MHLGLGSSKLAMQLGLLVLFSGIVLFVGGAIVSMLIDIYKELGLIPKAGYVFTCAMGYVVGLLAIGGGVMIVVYALANQG